MHLPGGEGPPDLGVEKKFGFVLHQQMSDDVPEAYKCFTLKDCLASSNGFLDVVWLFQGQ